MLRDEIDGFVKGETEDVAIVKGKAGKRLLATINCSLKLSAQGGSGY